jgi:hypothetical protein
MKDIAVTILCSILLLAIAIPAAWATEQWMEREGQKVRRGNNRKGQGSPAAPARYLLTLLGLVDRPQPRPSQPPNMLFCPVVQRDRANPSDNILVASHAAT